MIENNLVDIKLSTYLIERGVNRLKSEECIRTLKSRFILSDLKVVYSKTPHTKTFSFVDIHSGSIKYILVA